MDKNDTETVPLSSAAMELGISYERAKRLLLIGELSGSQEDGRWWRVSAESVERVKRERAEQSMPAAIA